MKKLAAISILLFVIPIVSCVKKAFYAFDNTTIIINSDRNYLKPNGDKARITVIGITEEGQAVHDHTLVMFSATMGSIPQSAEFMNGSATVEFTSGDRNGTAEVTARSGNNVSDTIEITIGSGALSILSINAEPSVLGPKGGNSKISVYAFDGSMNALSGVPVIMSTSNGEFSNKEQFCITDDKGLVRVSLFTQETATVTALSGSISKSVTVTVRDNIPPNADFSISPASAVVRQKVYFNGGLSSDSDGRIVRWDWDFGDGRGFSGKTAAHAYLSPGTFVVTLVVTDDFGTEGASQKSVTITEAVD